MAEWQNGTNQGIMGSGGGMKMGRWKRKKRRSKGRKRTMENCQTQLYLVVMDMEWIVSFLDGCCFGAIMPNGVDRRHHASSPNELKEKCHQLKWH
jgi:hypothetical protein